MKHLKDVAIVAAGAFFARAITGPGLVNYDTLYALIWGRDLGHGRLPDYGAAVAPTPHPLATALGALATPLSDHAHRHVHGEPATTLVLALAFVSLGVLGWVVFRLGAAWFNPWAGAAAAVLILTRQPVLDYGARAYMDIPYVSLVLGALLIETRRPCAGRPVLAVLAIAGLLRPEAWLFSAAYLGYLVLRGERDARTLGSMTLLAAVAPLVWLASDLAVTGDALHSLTGTRATARSLHRLTGIEHLAGGVPPRFGEILREPGLLAAAAGGALSLLWLRARALTGVVAAAVGLAAFAVLATAGLSILTRYLLGPAAIAAVFAGAALTGWLELPRSDERRRRWRTVSVLTGVVLLGFVPSQARRLEKLSDTLARQRQIQGDLAALVRSGAIGARCRPIDVPNHRPVPLLALWLDVAPGAIVSAAERAVGGGTYVTPASPAAAGDFVLDPRDPVRALAAVPAGFTTDATNRSWIVRHAGCRR